MPKYEYALMVSQQKTNWLEIAELPVAGRPEQTWTSEVWVFLPGAEAVFEGDNWFEALNRLGEDGWDLVATRVINAKVVAKLPELGWDNVSYPVRSNTILRREKS